MGVVTLCWQPGISNNEASNSVLSPNPIHSLPTIKPHPSYLVIKPRISLSLSSYLGGYDSVLTSNNTVETACQ